jgi:membrane dipeptidase
MTTITPRVRFQIHPLGRASSSRDTVVKATYEQLDLFHRLSQRYPKFFTACPNSMAAQSAFQSGRLISPLGIEGLHQIGNSVTNLRNYFALGARYVTLTHNCHTIYCDAALVSGKDGNPVPSTPYWHGVSPAGRDIIREMNRLGMIVDLSHVSRDTMVDVLGGSAAEKSWNGSLAPPIFSHSSAYALCPHPRNVPDDVLQLVKARRALVMVAAAPQFISCTSSKTSHGLPEFDPSNNTISQVVKHIRHIGELIGYDYVGIGTDFDGIPATPVGFEDVSKFPDLVAEMLRQGVSDEDAAKVVGRNLLRVWKEVDEVAARLQGEIEPLEDDIRLMKEEVAYKF